MRVLILSVLAALFLVTGATLGGPQGKKGKDKKEAKKGDWPTEINGKKADEWINAIAQSDRSESVRAMKTVLQFEPAKIVKAVPKILSELKKHKPPKTLLDTTFRANAPLALAMIMAAQEKPKAEDKAAFDKQCKDILETLKPMLHDPQIAVRMRTLAAVAQFGPYLPDVKDEILLNVGYQDTHEVREAAIKALASYPFDRKKEIPPQDVLDVLFNQGLKDPAASVRLMTLQVIEALHLSNLDKTKGAVNAAIDALLRGKEPDPEVRIAANLVAYGIDKKSNPGRRKDIASYLTHKDPAVRVVAINGLKLLGTDAQEQAAALVDCLEKKQDGAVRLAAFQALGNIGGTEDQADAVFSYTADKEPLVRVAALQAVSGFGKAAKKHVPAITALVSLKDKKELPVKMAAIQALGNLGTVAKGQEDLLLPLIDDKEVAVRVAAIQATASINPKSPVVLNKLIACLDDKDANVVLATAFALGGMGKDAESAVPLLTQTAKNKDLPAGVRARLLDAAEHIIRQANPQKTKG